MLRVRIKKICRQAGITLLIFSVMAAASLLLIDHHVKASVLDRIVTSEEAAELQADCILVLGAGVRSGGVPSPMLEDRLKTGIALYQSGAAKRLLMSGDHGRKDYDEVNVMKSYALHESVPSEAVFMDHAGFSTYESMYRARDIFGAKRIYDAESLGLEAYGVAADGRRYSGQLYRDFREILARGKDFFYGIVQPRPTYLGETIPLSGNGDVTNDR